MPNSTIKQIRLNDKYILVQSTALASNDTNPSFEVDYTWVFTKGSRTYYNAYHVIDHNSSSVDIEFDRDNSRLYIADEQGLTLTSLNEARLLLHYLEASMIGKQITVTVQAKSTDPHSNVSLLCQEVFTAILVSKENMTLFPSGMTPTSVYSVNYPKPLTIPLNEYVIGPNIEYQLKNKKGDDIPTYWINKVNKTSITMDYPPPAGDIVFFHSDVIPE